MPELFRLASLLTNANLVKFLFTVARENPYNMNIRNIGVLICPKFI